MGTQSTWGQFETQSAKSNMSVEKEETRGVFDPRTYREDDPVNWARKRRSDWLAVPGKIHYVRERAVASEEREIEQRQKEDQGKEEMEQREEAPVEEREPERIHKAAPQMDKKQETEFWPRKKRSDITASRVI